jgi:hypothetical protein
VLAVRSANERFVRTRSADNEVALHRAETTARKPLQQFASTTLRAFTQEVHDWHLAVRRYAEALGVKPPAWLDELPVEP